MHLPPLRTWKFHVCRRCPSPGIAIFLSKIVDSQWGNWGMLWDLGLTQTSARWYPSHHIHSGAPDLILIGLASVLCIPLTLSYSLDLHFGTTQAPLSKSSFLLPRFGLNVERVGHLADSALKDFFVKPCHPFFIAACRLSHSNFHSKFWSHLAS